MNTKRLGTCLTVVPVAILIAITGCSNNDPVSAGVQPQVINETDTFEFQVSSVQNYTGVWSYDWQTTGTLVNVDQSCAISDGAVSIRILDSEGNTVYVKDLAEGGSFTTSAGTTGKWHIDVLLNGCTGTLNFRTEKNQ